jgi:hypothetical protein
MYQVGINCVPTLFCATAATLMLLLQCPRCRAPVELPLHQCNNLRTHHKQVLKKGQKGVRNECTSCGFFAPDITQWARWDGTLAAEAVTAVVRATGSSGTGFWGWLLSATRW